jgi:hypothetical protein
MEHANGAHRTGTRDAHGGDTGGKRGRFKVGRTRDVESK